MNLVWVFWFAILSGSLMPATGSGQVKPVEPSAQQATKLGTIKGRVVAADTDLGLNKATISVFTQGGEGGEPRAVRTNENGDYEVTALKPGRYSVSASRGGYLSLLYGQKSPDVLPAHTGTLLHLREGETLDGINFRLVRYGAIEGRVVDASGEPMARATVQLTRYGNFEGRRRLVSLGRASRAQTDDRGHFRLFEIPPGNYYLNAKRDFAMTEAEGDRTATPATYYPGVLDPQEAAPIEVGPGSEIQGVDIALLAVRGFSISGRVVAPQDRLDRELAVWARRFGSDGHLGSFDVHGSTGSMGRFTLRNAIPGKYLVTASDDFGPTVPQSGILSGKSEVEVSDSDVSGVTIGVGNGGDISGRIVWPGDPSSVDPKRVFVRVLPQGGIPGEYPRLGEVGRDLNFSFKGIGEGNIRLLISLPPGPHYVKSIRVEGREAADQPFEIHNNDRLQTIVTIASDGAELVGTVKTESPGSPARGVTILAMAAQADLRASPRFRHQTQTDQEGKFSLRGLPPGEYLVAAIADLESGGESDPEFLKGLEKTAQRVELSVGQVHNETLTVISAVASP